VCVLRLLVGLLAFYYIASHSADLENWFGVHGLLPQSVVESLTDTGRSAAASWRWSYLDLADGRGALRAAHVLGLVVIIAFTVGFLARVTSILSLIVVLSYVHRGPMICGPFEPVLTLMLVYLCIAPSGACLSVDRLWRRMRAASASTDAAKDRVAIAPSLAANISLRLMQVHLAGLYLFMGLSKLAGEPWWTGEAVWWLIAHTETRLIDLTFLHRSIYLVNLWTHAIVLFELSFGILVWHRLARPLLLTLAIPFWVSLALVTGLVSYCAMMLVANICFIPPETLRSFLGARWIPSARARLSSHPSSTDGKAGARIEERLRSEG
jgi:hypothetical protein